MISIIEALSRFTPEEQVEILTSATCKAGINLLLLIGTLAFLCQCVVLFLRLLLILLEKLEEREKVNKQT